MLFDRVIQLGLLALASTARGCILRTKKSTGIETSVIQNSTERPLEVIHGAQNGPKLVFAHFMIGIASNRHDTSPYNFDMQLAKANGIDAFALNIGVDPYTDAQLSLAYASAAQNEMKVFISFDFNWYRVSDPHAVASIIVRYARQPAQLMYNGRVFVSSFAGDGLDVDEVRRQVRQGTGLEIYFAPNFHPREQGGAGFDKVDGALNWMGWRNNGRNKAPGGAGGGQLVTVDDGDRAYMNSLGNKGYIAPLSGWFFTHFGPEVPYSKNWVFPGDLLLYHRWLEILAMQPQFVEIVTWNDYGESHYMGPLSSRHTDDGASKWVNDMPHTGWLTLSKPFINALKAGATTLSPSFIDSDRLVYWYRIHPRDLNCDSTDTTMGNANNDSGNFFHGRPDGYFTMEDTISVVAFLRTPGAVSIQSGGTRYLSDTLQAGAYAFSVPFGLGSQRFAILRNGQETIGATSLKEIKAECPCGLYNFNPYVGTVPAEGRDSLDGDGLAAFSNGLRVGCSPQPSLPTVPPPTAPIVKSVGVGPVQVVKV